MRDLEERRAVMPKVFASLWMVTLAGVIVAGDVIWLSSDHHRDALLTNAAAGGLILGLIAVVLTVWAGDELGWWQL